MGRKSKQGNRQRNAARGEQQREAAFERSIALSTATVDAALETVERVVGEESQQPRFKDDNDTSAPSIFRSTFNWIRIAALADEPKPNATTREWDAWLRKFVMLEPYLAGVLNSVVQIDKNRGWELTGGEEQVNRFVGILHDADEGAGWRSYVAWQAQSYYNCRMGFVTEVGSEGEQGPLRALWSVDPARCDLTGKNDFPLRYTPPNDKPQMWTAWDYFRGTSLVSTDEAERGYGYPANQRNLDLARIMCAVWEHDKEQLGARAPKGLLLLNGISQEQWETAMDAREEMLNAKERQYYGGVSILASSGLEDLKATLFALSQLPKDFDLLTWVNLLMYGYALNFGYDAREFFPVNSGQLGSSKETEIQHRKASSKGEYDFALAHAEQLQARLPDSLQFEYEQRDATGEKLDAELDTIKAKLITEMANWKSGSASVLTAEQVLQLAAERGVIPEEWTSQQEDSQVSDTEQSEVAEERKLQFATVQRAMRIFPDSRIVSYNNRTQQMRTIYDPNQLKRHWRVERATVNGIVTGFKRDLKGIVRNYCSGGSTPTLLEGDLRDLVTTAVSDAFYAGLRQGGIPQNETGEDESQRADDLVLDQLRFVEGFADAVADACGDKDAQSVISGRVELWARSVAAAGEAGINMALANEMVEFGGEDGEESCATCTRLKGQRHRRNWFESKGLVPGQPGNENFECGGYRCQHRLVPVSRRTQRSQDLVLSPNPQYNIREQQPVKVNIEPAVVQIQQQPLSPEMEQIMRNMAQFAEQQHATGQNLTLLLNQFMAGMLALTQQVTRANEVPANIVVNVPQQLAPVVNVSSTPVTVENKVAAPIVNVSPTPVTVEVSPTPVTIENTVEVPPAPTSESLRVVRDPQGKITKVVKE